MKPDRNDNHADFVTKARKGVVPLDITDADNAQVGEPFRGILAGHCRAIAIAAFVANGAKS